MAPLTGIVPGLTEPFPDGGTPPLIGGRVVGWVVAHVVDHLVGRVLGVGVVLVGGALVQGRSPSVVPPGIEGGWPRRHAGWGGVVAGGSGLR